MGSVASEKNQLLQLCTARSVSDIGDCTVIHCDAGGVSLVDQWKEEKNWYRLTDQLLDDSLNR